MIFSAVSTLQFNIHHKIRYTYSRPIFLEPHWVRLQPRNCGSQVLREFDLQVEPAPAGISQGLDVEGNNVASIWFDGLHNQIAFSAKALVHCLRENPFDYLHRPKSCSLPLEYEGLDCRLAAPALQRSEPESDQQELSKFAEQISAEGDNQLLTFLMRR